MKGRVLALCLSAERGPKQAVPAIRLVANWGVEGDVHAGSGHRQVSLLDADGLKQASQRIPGLELGAFGENVITEGIDYGTLGLGSRLRLGQATIEITQVGKNCHDPCHIYRALGECRMREEGVFATVVEGGEVRTGDAVEVMDVMSAETVQVGVLTVSDRAARGEREDTAGPLVGRLVAECFPSRIAASAVVPDEESQIAGVLRDWCARGLDIILTTGGTGFAPRDRTPEATLSVIERRTPGLDETIRSVCRSHTPYAILSRGVSGICGSTLIINLPGSPKAAEECFLAIAEVLPHALDALRGRMTDCRPPRASGLAARAKAIAFVGPSGAGKTGLIERIIPALRQRGLRVAAVKHAPHGLDLEPEGKDSRRLAQAGAEIVALHAPDGLLVLEPGRQLAFDDVLARLAPKADVVLVEGYKESTLPKILVLDAASQDEPTHYPDLQNTIAVVGSNRPDADLPHFASDDVAGIVRFICDRLGLEATRDA